MQNKLKKVFCYNINYTNREAIISITGTAALESFINNGFVNYYNGESAPKELEIVVKLPENYLEDILNTESIIKEVLEQETGLTIKSFNFRLLV